MKRSIIAIILAIILTGLLVQPALAAVPHIEDPDAAQPVYSSISLLLYYSDSLDTILTPDPAATTSALSKMPFVNVPQDLVDTTGKFAAAGIQLSQSIAVLADIWQKENELVRQYRLDEAAQLEEQISAALPQARSQLSQFTAAAGATGNFLNIPSAASDSQLKQVYNEVIDKLNRLGAMLDLFSRPLINETTLKEILSSNNANLLKQILGSSNPDLLNQALSTNDTNLLKQILGSNYNDLLKEILKPTAISLDLTPRTAFVGDEVHFSGVLTSAGTALGDREVEILLNNTPQAKVATDAQGHYQGSLTVPYWYLPQADVQAIYYPQGPDAGVYLGISSPVVRLAVQYYSAQLVIRANGPAYPGRNLTLLGNFNYGAAAPIDRPKSELYLDDTSASQFTASPNFSMEFAIPPNMKLGHHTFTLSVPADGRYAPVNATCTFEVTQAAVILDFHTPGIALIPGSLGLKGTLHSGLGPLESALVKVSMNSIQVQSTSDSSGSFNSPVNLGMGWSLFGSQTVTVQVQPAEPWNAPITLARSIFLINFINCAILIVLLASLSIYLPRRLRNWYIYRPASSVKTAAPVPPVAAPVYQLNSPALANVQSGNDTPGSPLLNAYRAVLKLVLALTGVRLKSPQTLREYARETNRKLGPISRYFLEFTRLVERLLYSGYQPTAEDLEKGHQLAQSIMLERLLSSRYQPAAEEPEKGRRSARSIHEEARHENI